MSKEWNPETLFDVLASETARDVLALASIEPISASEIAEACDVSLPTAYRRVHALQEYDLLAEDVELDGDGNHYSIYRTRVTDITVRIRNGEVETDIDRERDLFDRFDELWSDLESDTSDEPETHSTNDNNGHQTE